MNVITIVHAIIASSDTLVVKVAKAEDVVSQPIIKAAETSDNNVIIAIYVCWTIAFVAIVVGATILLWKQLEYCANKKERVYNENKEQNEATRKQKSDLLNRKLELLKELCYDVKDKESKKSIKQHNSLEIQAYINAINKSLGIAEIEEKQ